MGALNAFIMQHLIEYLGGSHPTDWFYSDTVRIVTGYLLGTQVLDGTCSDIQCFIAHEAAKRFE